VSIVSAVVASGNACGFSGQALGAIITATSNGQHYPVREGQSLIEGMAQDAYELADAMLAERAKETDNAHD
jgi:hypothetical protein